MGAAAVDEGAALVHGVLATGDGGVGDTMGAAAVEEGRKESVHGVEDGAGETAVVVTRGNALDVPVQGVTDTKGARVLDDGFEGIGGGK